MADNNDNATAQETDPPPTPHQIQQQSILMAVETHYMAQKSRAAANINGYLNSSVGVAEHPDVVGEVIKLLKDIDEADGMINTLKRISTPQ
jgi:hypothetical protein